MYTKISVFCTLQNSQLTWADGTPYAYQRWLKTPAIGRANLTRTRLTDSWTQEIRESLMLPQPSILHNCTALFQLSTEDPMWVTVPCTARLNLGIVICEYDRNTSMPALPVKRATRECSTMDSVYAKGSCYNIYKKQQALKDETFPCGFCPLCHERLARIQALEVMAPYLGHILGSHPRRVLLRLNDTSLVLVRSDHNDMLYSDVMQSILPMSEHTKVPSNSTEDALLCEENVTLIADTCIHGQHQCDDGTCILDLYACDGSYDCPDGSDEINCTRACNFFGRDWWDGRDCFKECFASNCSCSTHYFQCAVGKCLPWSFVCNGRDDCGDYTDEVHCSSTVLNNVEVIETPPMAYLSMSMNQSHKWHRGFTLTQGGSIPEGGCAIHSRVGVCGGESDECFPKSALCLFEKNPSNGVRYCSQGGHLLSCQTFECPTMFKCPESYCIPMFAVCNDYTDCPNGEDEVGCYIRQCRGLLLCVKDNICVHPNNIVDGEVECTINMDDEQAYQGSTCPVHCDCKGHSINCATINILNAPLPVPNNNVLNLNLSDTRLTINNLNFEKYTSLLSLDLSKNEITELQKDIFKPLARLMFLHFGHNSITILSRDFFGELKHLRRLNILHNPLVSIESGAFHNLKSIKILDLGNLGIFNVMPFSFDGLEKCLMLSLSTNNISIIRSNTFGRIDQLRVLDLRGNPMKEISRDAFAHFENLNILVPFGQFCCFISDDHCEAPYTQKISSCKGYITNKTWSIYLWVLAAIILLFNLPASAFNMLGGIAKFNKLLVLLQVTSNTLSCLPIVCFIVVDHMLYREVVYGYSDTRLKGHPACLATSFLFAICFYVSFAVSATDILHKYIVIAHPLKAKLFESSSFYPIWGVVCLLVTITLSLLAIIHISAGELQAINSSCTAFGHGRSDSIALVVTPTLSYCALCLVFMVTMTLLTTKTLLNGDRTRDIGQMGNMKASILARDRSVALKLTAKAIVHSLAPGIFIIFTILDLADAIASADMSILVTGLVFPITPFINPILSTTLNKNARGLLFRYFYRHTN